MATKSTRLAAVNRALKTAGHDERLVRGRGYFYFAGGHAMEWETSAVVVYDVDALSVDEWLAERDRLARHEWRRFHGA